MGAGMPLKMSIITAVYNRVDTVAAALASVQAQRDVPIQHIVIDGGSTDGTLDILHEHRQRIAVLISEPDQGIYDALNKGLACATGDIVGVLHSDDVYADEHVLGRVAAAFAEPHVDAVYGDLDYVTSRGRVLRHWRAGPFVPGRLAWGWMPPHPTLHVRRSAYERLGGFRTDFRIAADYELVLRLLGRGGLAACYIPETLVRMRWGGASNRTLSQVVRKTWEDYRALRESGVGGLGALAWKNLSKLRQFL